MGRPLVMALVPACRMWVVNAVPGRRPPWRQGRGGRSGGGVLSVATEAGHRILHIRRLEGERGRRPPAPTVAMPMVDMAEDVARAAAGCRFPPRSVCRCRPAPGGLALLLSADPRARARW